MEGLKVTKDIAIRCILFGACKVPPVGADVSSFSQSELIWAEKMFASTELKKMEIPLWTRSGSGYGDGSGYGYGDGYGYGSDFGEKILKVA